MPLVYRVETKDGTGLYRGTSRTMNKKMSRRRHPLPDKDALLAPYWKSLGWTAQRELFFAFSTLAQLKSWIYQDEWRAYIDRRGLSVSVYRAKFVRHGDTQCVFKRHTAKKIGELSLIALDDPIRAT